MEENNSAPEKLKFQFNSPTLKLDISSRTKLLILQRKLLFDEVVELYAEVRKNTDLYRRGECTYITGKKTQITFVLTRTDTMLVQDAKRSDERINYKEKVHPSQHCLERLMERDFDLSILVCIHSLLQQKDFELNQEIEIFNNRTSAVFVNAEKYVKMISGWDNVRDSKTHLKNSEKIKIKK